MHEIKIAVDTSIVDHAFLGETPELQKDCYKSIYIILENIYLYWLFDIPSECKKISGILEEYRKKLSRNREFEIFWITLNAKGKVVYVNPKINDDLVNNLDRFKLQEEDRLFIYTAFASDKIIVTEDSDFGVSKGKDIYKDRYDFLTNILHMEIYNSNSFLNDFLPKYKRI